MSKCNPVPRIMCVIAICLGLTLVQCGSTVEQNGGMIAGAPHQNDTAPSMTVVQQNLSMADRLQSLPVSEYILGPEDTVRITVFRYDDMARQTTVSTSGKISYYLIGDVQAAGLTPYELRDYIQEQLRRFIKNPEVLVEVVEHRSHKMFVLGQVTNPGVFRMANDFSLVEAISAAGGLKPNAYLGGAYVVRDGKILLVNFLELIEKGNMTENIPLMPGDVVYIPNTLDRKVYVLGEVNNQSAIPVGDQLTLLSAIAEAGGFTNDAREDAILVMRGNLSKPEIIWIDASRLDGFTDLPLKPGDIVYVSTSGFAKIERVASRISNILDVFLQVSEGALITRAVRDILENKDYTIRLGN